MTTMQAAALSLWCLTGATSVVASPGSNPPPGGDAVAARPAQAQPAAQASGPAAWRPSLDLDPRFSAGERSSPVVVALYACGRSERCAALVPPLYNEVVGGRLAGKVRLHFRPFCPTATDDAAACCRALVAAARQGAFWPYLLKIYEHQESFEQCLLKRWADVEGLDRDAFEVAYDHPGTTALLVAAHREAVDNEVQEVPSMFVNGRRVRCGMSLESLIGLLEEEYDHQRPSVSAGTR